MSLSQRSFIRSPGEVFSLPLAALLLVLGGLSSADADNVRGGLAPRTELHSIETVTLSDQQFLTGDSEGKPTTTTGELRLATGSGQLPVVVLQHGSGGMGANIDMWARELSSIGISTFALDGFTGRGLTSVTTDQALLGRLNLVLDIYRSLDVLAHHPRVDRNKIALMGFSRGGQAALYASLVRFQTMWNRSGIKFAAYIPMYPDCSVRFISDTDVADRPIRIFGGTPDDYNPINRCKPYVQALQALGKDVQVTEYPNAPHSFDNPLGAVPASVAQNAQTVRDCLIVEESPGILINSSTGKSFTYADSCVQRNPHVGYDATATESAKAAVREFLATVFR